MNELETIVVWLQYPDERGHVSGSGYGVLWDALFKAECPPESLTFFLFGAALDAHLFQVDVVLESLRLVGFSEAYFYRRARTGWTCVAYKHILTENPERIEYFDASDHRQLKTTIGEPDTQEPVAETPQAHTGASNSLTALAKGEHSEPGALRSVVRRLRTALGR